MLPSGKVYCNIDINILGDLSFKTLENFISQSDEQLQLRQDVVDVLDSAVYPQYIQEIIQKYPYSISDSSVIPYHSVPSCPGPWSFAKQYDVIELFGESSSGKTQMAMSMAKTVMRPGNLGGVDGSVLILTQNPFSYQTFFNRRYNIPSITNESPVSDCFLSRLILWENSTETSPYIARSAIHQANTLSSVMSTLELVDRAYGGSFNDSDFVPVCFPSPNSEECHFCAKTKRENIQSTDPDINDIPPIRLIILDSAAFILAEELEDEKPATSSNNTTMEKFNMNDNNSAILLSRLKELAYKYQIWFVVTNTISDLIIPPPHANISATSLPFFNPALLLTEARNEPELDSFSNTSSLESFTYHYPYDTATTRRYVRPKLGIAWARELNYRCSLIRTRTRELFLHNYQIYLFNSHISSEYCEDVAIQLEESGVIFINSHQRDMLVPLYAAIHHATLCMSYGRGIKYLPFVLSSHPHDPVSEAFHSSLVPFIPSLTVSQSSIAQSLSSIDLSQYPPDSINMIQTPPDCICSSHTLSTESHSSLRVIHIAKSHDTPAYSRCYYISQFQLYFIGVPFVLFDRTK